MKIVAIMTTYHKKVSLRRLGSTMIVFVRAEVFAFLAIIELRFKLQQCQHELNIGVRTGLTLSKSGF